MMMMVFSISAMKKIHDVRLMIDLNGGGDDQSNLYEMMNDEEYYYDYYLSDESEEEMKLEFSSKYHHHLDILVDVLNLMMLFGDFFDYDCCYSFD